MDLFWSLVIVLSLTVIDIDFGESLKFCDQLNRNDNKISYAYRQMWTNDTYKHYVFIGQHFWRLDYKDSKDNKSVTIDDQNSGLSDTFGGQYSSAFCVWSSSGQCITGLFNNNVIDWEEVDNNGLNLKRKLPTKTTLGFPQGFKPDLGWVSSDFNTDSRVVVFMDTKLRQVKVCVITATSDANEKLPTAVQCQDNGISIEKHRHIYEKLDPTLNVIAIMAQYSDIDWTQRTKQKTFEGQGVIVMSQSGSVINYCYTSLDPDLAKTQCKADQMKVLIDCSEDKKPVDSGSPKPWIYLVILAIIAVIVIIGIVLVIYIFGKKNDFPTVKSKVDDNSATHTSGAQSSVERSALVTKQTATKSSVNPAVSPSKTS